MARFADFYAAFYGALHDTLPADSSPAQAPRLTPTAMPGLKIREPRPDRRWMLAQGHTGDDAVLERLRGRAAKRGYELDVQTIHTAAGKPIHHVRVYGQKGKPLATDAAGKPEFFECGGEPAKYAQQPTDELGLTKAKDGDIEFETGRPVTFQYLHNTEKSPRMGARFGQDLEPHGRYIQHHTHPDPAGLPKNLVSGEISFQKPLVLANDPEDLYGQNGWKARLSRHYGGLKGKRLTQALVRDGYDGIVTVDPRHGNSSEMVDLTMFHKRPEQYAAPQSPEFQQWFGESKVRHPETNEPLVVYHGTTRAIEAFGGKPEHRRTADTNRISEVGHFFTFRPDIAGMYADRPFNPEARAQWEETRSTTSNIVPAYLALRNPKVYDSIGDFYREAKDKGARLRDELMKLGHDGIWAKGPYNDDELVAFHPHQIKSATGNRGTYSPEDPRINYQAQGEPERYAVREWEDLANEIAATAAQNPLVREDAPIRQGGKHWGSRWMDSDKFHLLDVPLDAIDWNPGHMQKIAGHPPARTQGPIVIDSNHRKVGYTDDRGLPRTIVLDGQHRLQEARQRGDKTIQAWVGEKAVPHVTPDQYAARPLRPSPGQISLPFEQGEPDGPQDRPLPRPEEPAAVQPDVQRPAAGSGGGVDRAPATGEAGQVPPAAPSRKWEPITLDGGRKAYRAPNGTIWTKAQAGGEVSPITGAHFAGGRLMPIHGLSQKVEKVKPTGQPAPDQAKPNEHAKDRQPRPVRQLSPEDLEAERQRREDQTRWDEINQGPLGPMKWLGERPNRKAFENEVVGVKEWMQFAEQNPAAVPRIISALEPMVHAKIDRDTKDAESSQWFKGRLHEEATEAAQMFRGTKKHLKAVPDSLYARALVQQALADNPTVQGYHEIHRALQDATMSPTQQLYAAFWAAAFDVDRYARHKSQAGQKSLWDEDDHPREPKGAKGGHGGEFTEAKQSPTGGTANAEQSVSRPGVTEPSRPAGQGTVSPSAADIQAKSHTVHDVISGRFPVGVHSASTDEQKAKDAGLYTTRVGNLLVYAKDQDAAKPLVEYLEGGGRYGTPEFSKLLGYTDEEIDQYRRFLESTGRHDLLQHGPPPAGTTGSMPGGSDALTGREADQLPDAGKKVEPWQMTAREYARKMHELERPFSKSGRTWEEWREAGVADEDLTNLWSAGHEVYVRDALEKGRPVPAEVLADYPDLQPAPQGKLDDYLDPSQFKTRGEYVKAEFQRLKSLMPDDDDDVLLSQAQMWANDRWKAPRRPGQFDVDEQVMVGGKPYSFRGKMIHQGREYAVVAGPGIGQMSVPIEDVSHQEPSGASQPNPTGPAGQNPDKSGQNPDMPRSENVGESTQVPTNPDAAAKDAFGTGAGESIKPDKPHEFMSPDFAYRILNDVPLPDGGKLVASKVIQRSIRGRHPLFRVSVVENQDGTRYAVVENGADRRGSLAGAETEFRQIDSDSLQTRALQPIDKIAEAMWREHKPTATPTKSLFHLTADQFAQMCVDRYAEQHPSDEFAKWSAGMSSHLIDQASQSPLKLYHGTNNDFDEFDTEASGKTDSGWLGTGSYFTPHPDDAEQYGDAIVPVHVNLKNPFVVVDDHSNSPDNHFRFRQSIDHLPGLPPHLKLRGDLPQGDNLPTQDEIALHQKANEARRRVDAPEIDLHQFIQKMRGPTQPVPRYYRLVQGKDKYGRQAHMVISTSSPDSQGGVVESRGATPAQAIAGFWDKRNNVLGGFLLHTIVNEIGPERFRKMLQDAGHDGVVGYQDYGDGNRSLSEVVAFHPEQIKSVSNKRPTADPRLMYSQGTEGQSPERYAEHQSRLFEDSGGAPRREFDESKHARELGTSGKFARKYPRVESQEVQPALPGIEMPAKRRIVKKKRPVGQQSATTPPPAYPQGHAFYPDPLVSNGGASHRTPIQIHRLDDTHAHIGYGDAPELGYKSERHVFAKIPRESLEQFVNDLQGKVVVPPDHRDPRVRMIATGQAKFLGKGDDGMAFDTGDHVVKVSTVVPFHWTNYRGTYTPEQAARQLRDQVALNNEMLDAGVPGLLRQGFFMHGGKGFAPMQKLQIPDKFEQQHIDQMRETLDAMHERNYILRDDVQAGLGPDGRAYMFDTGKAKRIDPKDRWAKDDKNQDRAALRRLAEKHGLENPWAKDDAMERYNDFDNDLIQRAQWMRDGRMKPEHARRLIERGEKLFAELKAQDPEHSELMDIVHRRNMEDLQKIAGEPERHSAAVDLYFSLWNATLDRYAGQQKPEMPRVFYRGTVPGSTERIKEPFESAKGKTFAARRPESAKAYGDSIEVISAHPHAKILYQETPEFWKLLGRRKPPNGHIASVPGGAVANVNRAIQAAQQAGYDAISFSHDSDIGTVLLNEGAFQRGGAYQEPEQYTGRQLGLSDQPVRIETRPDAPGISLRGVVPPPTLLGLNDRQKTRHQELLARGFRRTPAEQREFDYLRRRVEEAEDRARQPVTREPYTQAPAHWTHDTTPPNDEAHYIDAEEHHRKLYDFYRNQNASSRTTPSPLPNPPVGSWRMDKHFGIYGREIEQLRMVPVADLTLSEGDYTDPKVNDEGRGDDARRYAGWMKAHGIEHLPPIHVVETDQGTHRVMNGHRRTAAAKLAGLTHIPAWVSPRMKTGKKYFGQDLDIGTGLTYEGALHGPDRAAQMYEERQRQLSERIRAERAAAEQHRQPGAPDRYAAPETDEFRQWFRQSHAHHPETKQPRVYYHGTNPRSAEALASGSPWKKRGGLYGWFDTDPDRASGYAVSFDQNWQEKPDGAVLPVYLSIQNPKVFRNEYEFPTDEATIEKLRRQGYDGVMSPKTAAVFDRNQIKSATGNKGTFSRFDERVTHSQPGQPERYKYTPPDAPRFEPADLEHYIEVVKRNHEMRIPREGEDEDTLATYRWSPKREAQYRNRVFPRRNVHLVDIPVSLLTISQRDLAPERRERLEHHQGTDDPVMVSIDRHGPGYQQLMFNVDDGNNRARWHLDHGSPTVPAFLHEHEPGDIERAKQLIQSAQPARYRQGEVHHTQTPEFKGFFGDWEAEPHNASKVIHPETGRPLEVYHGSGQNERFESFKPQPSKRQMGFMGATRSVESPVHFFSESPSMAHFFKSNRASSPIGGRVYKTYLAIRNPLDLTGDTRSNRKRLKAIGIEHDPGKDNMWELFDDPQIVSKIKEAGYDGALISERRAAKDFGMTPGNKRLRPTPTAEEARQATRTWVAFHPTQIKSVTNRGTWDPKDERMDYEQENEPVAAQYRQAFADAFVERYNQAAEQSSLFGQLLALERYTKRKDSPGQQHLFESGGHDVSDQPREADGRWTTGPDAGRKPADEPKDSGSAAGERSQASAPEGRDTAEPVPEAANLIVKLATERLQRPRATVGKNEELAARAQAGDRQALSDLWEANTGVLAQMFRNRWKLRPQEIEDAIQGAYEPFAFAVKKYDPARGVRFVSWMTRLVDQNQIKRVRHERGSLEKPLPREFSGGVPDGDAPRPEAVVQPDELPSEQADRQRVARRALETLKPRHREILLDLFGFNGDPVSDVEMARRTGMSKQRIGTIKHRGLEIMRQAIGDTEVYRQAQRNAYPERYARAHWETPEFREWFGDSAVRHPETGEPLVVYHGTQNDFDSFSTDSGQHGFSFALDPGDASLYANIGSNKASANVKPVYLSINNPKIVGTQGYVTEEDAKRYRDEGHDGVFVVPGWEDGMPAPDIRHVLEIVALNSKQIKSATGNRGTYSREDDRINYRQAFTDAFVERYALADKLLKWAAPKPPEPSEEVKQRAREIGQQLQPPPKAPEPHVDELDLKYPQMPAIRTARETLGALHSTDQLQYRADPVAFKLADEETRARRDSEAWQNAYERHIGTARKNIHGQLSAQVPDLVRAAEEEHAKHRQMIEKVHDIGRQVKAQLKGLTPGTPEHQFATKRLGEIRDILQGHHKLLNESMREIRERSQSIPAPEEWVNPRVRRQQDHQARLDTRRRLKDLHRAGIVVKGRTGDWIEDERDPAYQQEVKARHLELQQTQPARTTRAPATPQEPRASIKRSS